MRKGSSDTIRKGRVSKLSFYFEIRRLYIKFLLLQKHDNSKKRNNFCKHNFFSSHLHNSLILTAKISIIKLKLGLVEDIQTHLVDNTVSLQRGRDG